MTSTAGLTDRAHLANLRRLLAQRFSLSELRTLAFDLGIEVDSLSGQAPSDVARELVDHLSRRRRIEELVAYLRETRGDIDLALPAADRTARDTGHPSRPDASPETGVHTVWSTELPGQVVAAATVLDDLCMVAYQSSGPGVQGGVLRALDLNTGGVVWDRAFPGSVVVGPVEVAPGCVLLSLPSLGPACGDSAVIAVEPSGRVLWRTEVEVQQISAPCVCGDLAAVTGNGRRVLLLDTGTGDVVADVMAPVQVAATPPACDGELTFVPCRVPTLLAIGRDGEIRWRFDVDGVLSSVQLDQRPLVSGDFVVAVLSSGSVLALDRATGKLAWETQVGLRGKRLTSPVSDGKRVFVGGRDGVYALSLTDGAPLWAFRTGAHVTAPPALGGDLLCIAGSDRHLYGVDRYRGGLQWEVTVDQEIKVGPRLAVAADVGPLVIAPDCAGRVVARAYPVPADRHEAAGRWALAARTRQSAGELARAAEDWVRHAEALTGSERMVDQQAEAWGKAAQLFEALGRQDRADAASRKYAQCLALPLVTLEILHDGLTVDAWSTLQLTLRNDGYGLARDVVVRAAGDTFEGQIAASRRVPAIPLGESLALELTVKPTEHGDSVPLQVQLSYQDDNGEPHRRDELLKVSVSPDAVSAAAARLLIPAVGPVRWVAGEGRAIPVDIEIRVRRGRRDYDVELTLNGEQVFGGGRLPRAVLSWERTRDVSQDGQYLLSVLLHDRAVAKGWNVARGQAEERGVPRRIRLRIDDDAAELHRLPWELMVDEGVMMAASEKTPFSRYLPSDRPWGAAVDGRPLRVLAAIASPADVTSRYGLPPLDVALERFLLARAFSQIDTSRVVLTFLKPPITLERLSRTMLEGYDLLHYIGHGRLNPRYQRVDLLMEDAQGNSRTIGDRLFSGMLARQGVQPQLVFLSVCQSAGAPEGEVMESLVPQLVRIGIPAVVAMRGRLPVRTAQSLTQSFYRGLVSHGHVDLALNQARAAVLAAQLPEVTAPVLFMHLASGRLWSPSAPSP